MLNGMRNIVDKPISEFENFMWWKNQDFDLITKMIEDFIEKESSKVKFEDV